MRRSSLFGIVTSSALILTSTLGWADGYASRYVGPAPTNWILNSNNQISVDFVSSHIDYLETLGGPLDTEKGWLWGASASGSFMGNVLGIRNVYVFGQFTYLGDHTTHGEANPVFNNTRTEAQIRDEDFRLGVGLSLSRDVMLTPYLGLGEHYWLREFTGAGAYREEYSNGYVGAGLLLQYSPVPRLVLSANGLIGGTIDPRLKATQNGGFPIPNQTFDLGGANIWKAGAASTMLSPTGSTATSVSTTRSLATDSRQSASAASWSPTAVPKIGSCASAWDIPSTPIPILIVP